MKIGIDARMIEHSGIGTRLQNILKILPEYSQNQYYLFGSPEQLKKFPYLKNYNIVEYDAKVYSVAELLGHPEMGNMDLLDIPHFNVPIRYIHKCVVTIHDIIPFKFKNYHSGILKQLYFAVTFFFIKKFARKIITVSDYTRKDLQNILHIDKNNLLTISNAVDHSIFKKYPSINISRFKRQYKLPANYLLTVGIGKKHKNLVFILKALSHLWDSGKFKIPIVIAGAGGIVPEYAAEWIKKYKKFILILPKIPENELPFLYQGAVMLLFPSLYEGFGFPLLEAQGTGCPVMSSDKSVMKEILQDSAIYFNPENATEFIEKFQNLLKDKRLQQKKITEGFKNANRFNWEVSVRKIIDIYHAYANH